MRRMAAHIGPNWNVFFEMRSTYPTPFVDEKYSASTIVITASEIGSSAGGGIARHHSMCGIHQIRAHRERPSGSPIATPATTAIANPAVTRTRLGTTCVPNCEKSQRSWNSPRIVDSFGNLGLSAEAVHS